MQNMCGCIFKNTGIPTKARAAGPCQTLSPRKEDMKAAKERLAPIGRVQWQSMDNPNSRKTEYVPLCTLHQDLEFSKKHSTAADLPILL